MGAAAHNLQVVAKERSRDDVFTSSSVGDQDKVWELRIERESLLRTAASAHGAGVPSM